MQVENDRRQISSIFVSVCCNFVKEASVDTAPRRFVPLAGAFQKKKLHCDVMNKIVPMIKYSFKFWVSSEVKTKNKEKSEI